MHCSKSLTNTNVDCYKELAGLLSTLDTDIPIGAFANKWVYEQLDNAINLAENNCVVTPLYEVMYKPISKIVNKDIKVSLKLSYVTPFVFDNDGERISLPLIKYEIDLCPLIPKKVM